MEVKTISLERKHVDYVEKKALNLSKFVRMKLDEEMDREEDLLAHEREKEGK